MDATPLPPELEYFLSANQWLDASGGSIEIIVPALIESVRGTHTRKASGREGNPSSPGSFTAPVTGTSHTSEHGHGLPIKIPFLEKLKRRNVGRVAILYIGICYLILEFFSTFLHVLALPEWTGRTLAALMVVGFPVVLIFAWIFELTPQGIKPAAAIDINSSTRKLTGRRLDFAIIIVLVLALGYFAADKFWFSQRADMQTASAPAAPVTPAVPGISEKSIAVLPFTDMSEKKDQEYFADGLSEELIDHLAHNVDLKVIARTSSFAFKGKNEDMRSIATKLGVAKLTCTVVICVRVPKSTSS